MTDKYYQKFILGNLFFFGIGATRPAGENYSTILMGRPYDT